MSIWFDDPPQDKDDGLNSESSQEKEKEATEQREGQGEKESKERLLNQAEIDTLLRSEDKNNNGAIGIEAILNSGKVSYERLPMLEVVLDRLVRHLSTSLRNFTNDNVEVTLEKISSTRFGEYLDHIPLPTLLGVFGVEQWEDSPGLIRADRELIYSIVDVLLGAKRGDSSPRAEGRSYTTIEQSLVEKLFKLVLHDFSLSFEPISPVTFRLGRLETNPSFATIVRPVNVAIVATLKVEMENRGGILEFLLPYASLEPVRDTLIQMFMGEKFGQDSMWEKHFAGELWETRIPIKGVLKTLTMNLNDVLKWKKGTQVMLDVKADAPISLKCGDLRIGEGRMGQKNNKIAIQIEKSFIKEKKKS